MGRSFASLVSVVVATDSANGLAIFLTLFNAEVQFFLLFFRSGPFLNNNTAENRAPEEHGEIYMFVFDPGGVKVVWFIYALGQGAAAIAVDIEKDIHPGITRETISTKISLHQVQRRKNLGDTRTLQAVLELEALVLTVTLRDIVVTKYY
ncbi:hypothetical protein CR513_59653, partial [Mucuna pruriens]